MGKIKYILNTQTRVCVLLFCISLFTFSYFYLSLQNIATAKDDFIGRNEENLTDLLDYHFIATNFLFTNQFPIVGYMRESSAYRYIQTESLILFILMFTKKMAV